MIKIINIFKNSRNHFTNGICKQNMRMKMKSKKIRFKRNKMMIKIQKQKGIGFIYTRQIPKIYLISKRKKKRTNLKKIGKNIGNI